LPTLVQTEAAAARVTFIEDDESDARIELFGNAALQLQTGEVTVGSIEGDGVISFSNTGRKLTIGNNDLSTTFSGTIQDLATGSLEKIGKGTLTLTGANSYDHGTTISDGILLVSNTSGSGTGTGNVNVNGGTLGGSGIVAGAVTVGTNSGAGAFLAPSKGERNQQRSPSRVHSRSTTTRPISTSWTPKK
jgi:autotransporter-associated beta strand protein